MEARGNKDDILKSWKKEEKKTPVSQKFFIWQNCPFKNEGEIKIFLDEQGWGGSLLVNLPYKKC